MAAEIVIAHIDMDAFFAAVEQRDNPALKGKPVVIGADPKEGKGRGVVSTCSYEARPFGIHSAQPISLAYKKCPHAVFLRGDHKKYRTESKIIFSILSEFTPDIQPVSIDEAFMDWSGCWHLHGSVRKMALAVKERIRKETGLVASIGVAPVKFVSKIASDYYKPDGLKIVSPDQLKGFLSALDIDNLWGVGKKSKAILNDMGIYKVADLAAYDHAQLIERMGEHGQHLYNLAHGIDPRGVEVDDEIKSVSHEHTFSQDEQDPDEVKRSMLELTEKVCRRLRRYGLKGRTVSIKVRTRGFHTFTRAETVGKRVNLIDDVFEVAAGLFDQFYKPGMHIRLIGVRVSQFEDPYVSDSLFEDDKDKKREAVHDAMDEIKDKFGEQSIHRGAK